MKLPAISMPRLEVPRLGLASFGRRILVRGVFLLLALATLALAVVLLQEEKERSYRNYAQGFRKTQAEIAARLRHPAGQLALLNPQRSAQTVPLRPLLLPFSALDFDDQYKAQQAVETAGCSVTYPDGASLCVAIGTNPYAGGFIYLVGSIDLPPLIARERGMLDLSGVHRARVVLEMRGTRTVWLAPFELMPEPETQAPRGSVTGRLTGFLQDGVVLPALARPQRDFRGWLWQGGRCADGKADPANCLRRAYISIRLPVEAYREALFGKPRPVWPPADLDLTLVHLQLWGPEAAMPLFDSDGPGASSPQALDDVRRILQPGEAVRVRKTGPDNSPGDIAVLRGLDDGAEPSAPWLTRLIAYLPVPEVTLPALTGSETISTMAGSYELVLTGSVRGIERALGVAATRMSWYVGAMLSAILLAWLVLELGLLRQVKVLTRRAAAVSYNVNAQQVEQRLGALDVSDLRGKDELGILAGALADLLQRVKDDVKREHIRAEQERDIWHAVGHEIMSPLQSLMVLHPGQDDASHRYVQRMQQAVKVLYGQASPSEALAAADLQVAALDLDAFLRTVAGNAHFAGVQQVFYESLSASPVLARADEFPLEDVVTHILRNADRHRTPATPITLTLEAHETTATVHVSNQGPQIDPALLERIFEYGVSGEAADRAANPGQRGQGLFVARTYMAKMGGTIEAKNTVDGVSFVLRLRRFGH